MVILKKSEVPIVEDALRPYRIWDSTEKKNLPYRAYSIALHAHWAAVHAVLYGAVPLGVVLEVYNTLNGKLIGQYRLKPNGDLEPWFERKSLDDVYEVAR
jgi:hypothetical protein